MSGKKVGYIRVSSEDQNSDRQLDGVTLDKRFIEVASGKSQDRPQLKNLLEYIREEDRVIVHSMDRLARNLVDLRNIVKKVTSEKASIEFVKENITFTGNDSAISTLFLSMMGAFAEFERSVILERQREGIALAKSKGKYKGRKKSLTESDADELRRLVKERHKKTDVAKRFGISRVTLYEYLKRG